MTSEVDINCRVSGERDQQVGGYGEGEGHY